MVRFTLGLLGAVAMFVFSTADVCLADSTASQLQEQQLGIADPAKAPDDALNPAPDGGARDILLKFDYLSAYFELMDEPGGDGKLEESFKSLQQNPRVIEDLTSLYDMLSKVDGKDSDKLGEARWRALYVMGELRDKRAADLFLRIAETPLPNPEAAGEVRYKTEYRLHARAIDGLEKLKDVELLKKIYGGGGVFTGLAAASLFELGQAPKGITKVDGAKVLGLGDPKDYNPARGSGGAKSPVGLEQSPSDDEVTVTPRWPVAK